MLRRYPDTLRWRQALPPLFILSLLGLALLSIFVPLAKILFVSELVIYFSALLLTACYAASKQRQAYFILGLPLAISAMHLSWGSGFLWSMLASNFQNYG